MSRSGAALSTSSATCSTISPNAGATTQSRPSGRGAWPTPTTTQALEQLNNLALKLDRAYPGAAASLREGMEETLTVTRLGITGKLKQTLQSTNPIESMISTVRVISRNVKHWTSGEMCLRWTAAGMLEAETRFRTVQGYRGLANLAVAIEHDLHPAPQHRHEGLTATLTA